MDTRFDISFVHYRKKGAESTERCRNLLKSLACLQSGEIGRRFILDLRQLRSELIQFRGGGGVADPW